jgi:ADP-heptose:LPS heptosyltransferase
LVGKWALRLSQYQNRRRIGIAWAGNPAHYNDHNRSIPFGELAPILGNNNVAFFSLQKEKRPRDTLPPTLPDFTSDLTDFSETAAFIENLDLLITVDTSVAHLAGAIGKPTWLLLPYVTDWRWLLDRDDTPWYPTMRLFRQTTLGSWKEPVEAISRMLA